MTWTTPIAPLVHGEIRDAGYSEFITSESFAIELLNGGMTRINGQPVKLEIVDRLAGIEGVTIRWTPVLPGGSLWIRHDSIFSDAWDDVLPSKLEAAA